MKKRIVSFILSVLMLCSLTACGSPTPTTSGATQSNDAAATPITVPAATTPAPVTLEDAGTLGDYDVQIHDFKLANDYAGKPAILIGFSFTNNSEENESVMFALSYKAYQNGVQLDSAIIMDNSVYNADDLMKDVQPGASIDVVAAYSLSSETAPVEFEVEEIISFSDEMLGKTFEIAEGGVTELSVAQGSDTAQTIDDYAVSIISYKIGEDYQGKKAIIFDLGFTNNGDKATSFALAIDFSAFQDGVELETAILHDDDLSGSSIRDVKPGAGIETMAAFVLTNDTSPVEIEIKPFLSFSSDEIKTEINIAG